jgi:flagellar FliL protein
MSTTKTQGPASEAVEGRPKKSGKGLVLLVVGGVVLLAGGAGAWFLAPGVLGARPRPAEAKKEEAPVKATISLGALVVNLSDETRRYLRVAVSLGVPGPKETKEIEEARPQLLDLTIAVLSSADVASLTSEDGRAALKDKLLGRIRGELGLTKVARVYFTEFVIQ